MKFCIFKGTFRGGKSTLTETHLKHVSARHSAVLAHPPHHLQRLLRVLCIVKGLVVPDLQGSTTDLTTNGRVTTQACSTMGRITMFTITGDPC